jgi:hypothetical protein
VAFPSHNSQIVAQGLARLTSAFIAKPHCRAWLAAILQPVQDLEDATWGVLLGRFLRTATVLTTMPGNVVFDSLGALVGLARGGLYDTDYKAMIFLRVAVNRAQGRTTDWSNFAAILLANFASGPVALFENGGTIDFGVWGFSSLPSEVNIPNLVAQALALALPNGVAGTLAYSTWPDGNDFSFSSRVATGAGEAGFGSRYSAPAGGVLVAAAALLRS